MLLSMSAVGWYAVYRRFGGEGMGCLITLVRLSMGIFAICVAIPLLVILFFFATLALMICMPFTAIFMDRGDIKDSWMGTYPNTLRAIPDTCSGIGRWVFDD